MYTLTALEYKVNTVSVCFAKYCQRPASMGKSFISPEERTDGASFSTFSLIFFVFGNISNVNSAQKYVFFFRGFGF